MHPEVLVQLRDKLVADAEGFNVHRRQHKSTRIGEDAKVRRSPQAAACRKRHVRELGKPLGFPAGGKVNVGHTDSEAQKGKPGNGTMRESKRTLELSERAGGGVL